MILELIRDLATDEGATHEVTARKEQRLNLSCCCAKEEGLARPAFLVQLVNFHQRYAGRAIHSTHNRGVSRIVGR
jgi:hypothetical protein